MALSVTAVLKKYQYHSDSRMRHTDDTQHFDNNEANYYWNGSVVVVAIVNDINHRSTSHIYIYHKSVVFFISPINMTALGDSMYVFSITFRK